MPWVIIAVLVLLVLSKSGRLSAEQDPGPQWHQMPPSDWSVGAHYYGPPPAQPPKAFTPPPADFSGPLARVGAVGAHCAGLNVIDCARATGNLLASGGTGYIVPVPAADQAPGLSRRNSECQQVGGPSAFWNPAAYGCDVPATCPKGTVKKLGNGTYYCEPVDLVELHANIGPGHF